MDISTNIVNKMTNKNILPARLSGKQQVNFGVQNQTNLPSTHTIGQSQINANLPINYTKIGEISLPGVKKKASVFKLANGQKVVILPKKGPTVVKTTYNVGSMNETDDIRGMSHYIEHNLFNGSKDLAPKEYDKRVSDLGGYTNASTSYNTTDYYLSLQLLKDNSLEDAIKLNASQTQFPTFPAEQLEKEKEPVKSEIDMYLDDEFDVGASTVAKNLFGIQTASTNPVIGTKGNINSFTREKVLDYYNTWYTPDNAITVITGDVDTNEAINLVSKYYNKQNDNSKINQRHSEPFKYIDKTVRNDIIMPNSSSSGVFMGFAIPEGTSKEDQTKIDILMSLLQSKNSRVSKALDKYGLNLNVFSEKMQNKPDSARSLTFNVNLTENQIEEVLQILYKEISHIANNPPALSDLNNIKQSSIYSIKNSAETSEDANSLLTYLVKNNDWNYINEEINRVSSITPEDISAVAKKFLDLNKTAICVTHSKDATAESIQNNYKNSQKSSSTVSFGSSKKVKDSIAEDMNKVKCYKLANNIQTQFVESPAHSKSRYIMSLQTDELNSVTAPAFDVLNVLFSRGNAFRNYETVVNMHEGKDSQLNFTFDENGLVVSSSFYTKDTNELLALMKETLMNPNFSQQEFERAKKIIKDYYLTENASSTENVMTHIFKDIKSYADKETRIKQLDALTLDDVKNLYARVLNTAETNVTINSPIEEYPDMQNVFNYGLSYGLPVFKSVTVEKSPSYNMYKPITQTQTIAKAEESNQADICQAYTYKESKNIDDIAKISLLNIILGKGMSSRLFTDLREKEKLAYSVRSNATSIKDTGLMLLQIGTTTESIDANEGSPENAKKAIEGFNRNVNLLKTENVSEKELEDAKIKLKTACLNEIETSLDKMATVHTMMDSPYGLKYNEELISAIDKVTVDDIRSAANYVFANPPITSIVASQKTLDALNLKSI